MPVILAIEPDRRQATKIAPVLRGLGAELVLADSVARAFDAIGDRIPDLVLTSALLSRQDEAALAARLRELGAAAAHVQELTIPILATPSTGTSKRRGVLSTLRRGTTRASAPDGCEPDMFAAQVALYLDRAAAERKVVGPPAPQAIEIAPTTLEIAPAILDLAPEPTLELLLLPPGMLPEPSASAEPHLAIEIEDDSLLPLVCGYEPVQPAPAPVEESRPAALQPAPPPVEKQEHWLPVMFDQVCDEPLPVEDDVWILPPVTGMELLEITVPASAVVARPPAKQEPAPEPVPVAKPGPPEPIPNRKKKVGPSKKKPVQDEWGFFDPDQCGFAALVAKLDDVTETGASEHEQETTVRVIPY